MSSLWLLKAKPYSPHEDRSAAAYDAQFWLRPGTYSVGRSATQSQQCDVECLEDDSVSRQHACIEVPSLSEWQAQGDAPFVTIRDSSKYGTHVSAVNDLAADSVPGMTAKVFDRWLIRFGNLSPFRCVCWELECTPQPGKVQGCPHRHVGPWQSVMQCWLLLQAIQSGHLCLPASRGSRRGSGSSRSSRIARSFHRGGRGHSGDHGWAESAGGQSAAAGPAARQEDRGCFMVRC